MRIIRAPTPVKIESPEDLQDRSDKLLRKRRKKERKRLRKLGLIAKGPAKTQKQQKLKIVRPKPRWADPFIESPEWRYVRQIMYRIFPGECMKCGKDNYGEMNVDHVIPRKIAPLLALDPRNLQILCGHDNKEKLNTVADYRTQEQKDRIVAYLKANHSEVF